MNILEKEIEDVIWDAMQSDTKLLIDRGLYLPKDQNYLRQVNLGGYGIADIIGYRITSYGVYVTIYELKKEVIDTSTLLQAARYAKAVCRIFKHINRPVEIYICLIGKTFQTSGDFCFLVDWIDNLRVYTYSLDLVSGIKFKEHHGYYKTNEGLPEFKLPYSEIKGMLVK